MRLWSRARGTRLAMRSGMRKLVLLVSLLVGPSAFAERYAYVASKADSTVSAIDVDTGAVVATIPVGPDPRGVAEHPDGRTVFVAARGSSPLSCSDRLYIIDVPAHTVRHVTLTLDCPTGIALDPDGDYLYIAHDFAEYITRIPTLTLDPAAIEEIPVGHTGGTHIAVDPEGDVLYEVFSDPTTGGGDLSWFDVDNGYSHLGTRTGVAPFPGALVAWVDHIVFLTRQSASGGRQMISVDTKSPTGLILPITGTGDPAGVALRPVLGTGIPTYHVTRRTSNEIAQVFGTQVYATQAAPVALAWSDDEDDTMSREAFVSANFDAGSATVARADGTLVHVAVGQQPQAVAAGAVLRPRLEWRPPSLGFTWTVYDLPITLRLTLRNTGTGWLALQGPVIEGPDSKTFKISRSDCPTRVLPGASCNHDVTFTARPKSGEERPTYRATLELRSNDGTKVVTLTAKPKSSGK